MTEGTPAETNPTVYPSYGMKEVLFFSRSTFYYLPLHYSHLGFEHYDPLALPVSQPEDCPHTSRD